MQFRLILVASGFVIATSAFAQSIQTVPPGNRPVAPATATPAAPAQPAAPPMHAKVDVERKGRAENDIFLGTYLSLDRECKVGSGPRIEFMTPPKSGKTRTRNHPINLRDVPGAPRRNCIGTSPNGVAVIYRADRRFKGEETIVFKAIYPNGDTREVTAKVLVQ